MMKKKKKKIEIRAWWSHYSDGLVNRLIIYLLKWGGVHYNHKCTRHWSTLVGEPSERLLAILEFISINQKLLDPWRKKTPLTNPPPKYTLIEASTPIHHVPKVRRWRDIRVCWRETSQLNRPPSIRRGPPSKYAKMSELIPPSLTTFSSIPAIRPPLHTSALICSFLLLGVYAIKIRKITLYW